MNLRFLETFVWVARLKSFSLAAEKLHATQAAVSSRIATLERELGVRLFERDPREVRLTPAGVDALEDAERIVKLSSEFRQRVSNPHIHRGTVRIGVIDSIAHAWLTQLIDHLRRAYPNIVVELHADTSVNIAEHLRANVLDVGLFMGPLTSRGAVNADLCTFASVWVASPRLAIGKHRIAVGDLAMHPILSFPRDSMPHQVMIGYFDRREAAPARLYTSNSLSTIIRLAVDGIGVAALPAAIIQSELADGRLEALNVLQPFPPLSFHASYVEAPENALPGLIANMARDVAQAWCRERDPSLAW